MIKKLKYRKKNKKAIFFTIMAISLLSLFLVSYSVYSFVQNREGINRRIKTMNSYISSLEEDIPRKLYITGYRIIFVMGEKIIKEGNYINNLDSNFSEAFFNGTIGGEDYAADNDGLLYGTLFKDMVREINKRANSLNINVSFINPKILISQDDPWRVKISLESNLIIKDRGDLANWNRDSAFYTYIPIKNFEDPLYTLNTNAKVVNKFVQTNYSVPISVGNIIAHAENSYYINHTDAPSFLQRLEGDLTPDPDNNGIESLVNTHELSRQGIIVKEKCTIDYIYFSDTSCSPSATYGAGGWIKIDATHLDVYGV
jgi:hypothetical protein